MFHRSTLAVCVLALSACGAAPSTPAPASMSGTRWIATGDGADSRAAPRLEFISGGRLSGFNGCNMLSGTWRMEDGQIRFGAIASTKRMCLGSEGETERRFMAALGSATTVRRVGGKLILDAPGGARFELSEAR